MADFGEALPFDAVLYDDVKPADFHNAYPEVWAQVNREVIAEAGLEGDAVFFMRSGFTQAPQHATLFWLGDQLTCWRAEDGIKNAVTGLLSRDVRFCIEPQRYRWVYCDHAAARAISIFQYRSLPESRVAVAMDRTECFYRGISYP